MIATVTKTRLFGSDGLIGRLRRLWKKMPARRHGQYGMLLCLMLVSAIAEIVSLGAVLPFLGALAAPETIMAQPYIEPLVQRLGITQASQLLLPLTILFIAAALFAGAVRLLLLFVSTRLIFATGADLSAEVYCRTLYQPYSTHLSRNSSEVISGIANKTQHLMFDIILPSVTLINSGLVLSFIFSALVFVNPVIALGSALGFGVCYVFIALVLHKRLARQGKIIAQNQTGLIQILQEGLGGIRDVLLDGTQSFYAKLYRDTDRPLRRAQGNNLFMSGSPRYIIESLGMVFIAMLAFVLSQKGGLSAALPVLGALALGVQRMLPALQQGYNSWSLLVGNQAALVDVLGFLDQPLPEKKPTQKQDVLSFKDKIELDKIVFRYGAELPTVLEVDHLIIPQGARVGIVGETGSGKSTLLDLVMGLLIPSEGFLCVDGEAVTKENNRAWQKKIAHVPQAIYLADSTITENIAFGIPVHEIDMARVKEAAACANIAHTIEAMPTGYETKVGERGARLSGGQRQRIGIARALYKKADLLVLDEATSALDHETEKAVMASIEQFKDRMTILMVAHRVSTLKGCDFILSVEKGKLLTLETGALEEMARP